MNKSELREQVIDLAASVVRKRQMVYDLESKVGSVASRTSKTIDMTKYFHWDVKSLKAEYKKLCEEYDSLSEYWDTLWAIYR